MKTLKYALLKYALCPQCFRAVPVQSGERFCPNDGAPMVTACPVCGASIAGPYARHCTQCGTELLESGAPPPVPSSSASLDGADEVPDQVKEKP